MSRYECTICGYVYDESMGIPEVGIAPGTKWEDLPDDWECPLCGAPKSDFELMDEGGSEFQSPIEPAEPANAQAATPVIEDGHDDDLRQMDWGELAAVFSNLARGCEKQYLTEEQGLFVELAEYFTRRADAGASASGVAQLTDFVDVDIAERFPHAEQAALTSEDRGALRALTWSGKVTRIVGTLLARYRKEGESFLEGQNVYVCEICGFVYVGAEPPGICPVCKVPSWKFLKVEGGRVR